MVFWQLSQPEIQWQPARRSGTNNINYQFNPIEKIVQLYDEKVELSERLLQSEKDKVELLQKVSDERK